MNITFAFGPIKNWKTMK